MQRVADNRRVPMVEGRDRRPSVMFRGDEAVVIHYLALEPDEEIDDSPPEERMSREEWRRRHAEFGLDRYGQRL